MALNIAAGLGILRRQEVLAGLRLDWYTGLRMLVQLLLLLALSKYFSSLDASSHKFVVDFFFSRVAAEILLNILVEGGLREVDFLGE